MKIAYFDTLKQKWSENMIICQSDILVFEPYIIIMIFHFCCFPGQPDVKLTGVKQDIDIETTPLGGNKYRCTYVPNLPGKHQIIFLVCKESLFLSLKMSPFEKVTW